MTDGPPPEFTGGPRDRRQVVAFDVDVAQLGGDPGAGETPARRCLDGDGPDGPWFGFTRAAFGRPCWPGGQSAIVYGRSSGSAATLGNRASWCAMVPVNPA